MRESALEKEWFDWHYDYNDPPAQASGPAEPPALVDGFRIFSPEERFSIGEWARKKGQIKRAVKIGDQSARRAETEAGRGKGLLHFCSRCRNRYQSNSTEVGVFVCPNCRSKGTTEETQT
jgi:hypothetical protein